MGGATRDRRFPVLPVNQPDILPTFPADTPGTLREHGVCAIDSEHFTSLTNALQNVLKIVSRSAANFDDNFGIRAEIRRKF